MPLYSLVAGWVTVSWAVMSVPLPSDLRVRGVVCCRQWSQLAADYIEVLALGEEVARLARLEVRCLGERPDGAVTVVGGIADAHEELVLDIVHAIAPLKRGDIRIRSAAVGTQRCPG